MSVKENNKRIFKNTMYLYIRMAITLVIGLYTSRIILQALGAVDFGLYNVVGGIVTMLTFLSNTMSSASQRFFSFEIGRNDITRLKDVFSSSVGLYIALSGLTVVIAETIGLWLVCYKLNIPPERYEAAKFVYQFTILTFIFTILRVPYNALIIAREKMNFFAWISIVEVILKLLIVYMLAIGCFDKLKLYSVLMFLVALSITFVYFFFCRKNFEESRINHFSRTKDNYLGLLTFSGWSMFGSLANMLMDQGVNILLNIFFGPAVNAARGIAYQVKGHVMTFVTGFQTATNPQIIKYYSSGNFTEMKNLLFRGSRITYYLLLLVTLPIFLEMDMVLSWWLHEVPKWTTLFARLVFLIVLVDSLSGCMIPAINATGKIRIYQIGVGLTKLFNLPITYMLFKLGFSPDYAMTVSIFLNFLCLFVRMHELKRLLNIDYSEYLREVILYDFAVTIVGGVIPVLLYIYIDGTILGFFIIVVASLISNIITISFIGLRKTEREQLWNVIMKKLNH